MQRLDGHEGILGASQGCFAAFAAVYECPVPVIAAVHGFCLGGGIGLAGQRRPDRGGRRRDVRAARGRPGRARRRHPPRPAGAAAAAAGDGVHLPDRHRAAAAGLRHGASAWCPGRSSARPRAVLATAIAAKDPLVIRLAKQSLNGIDPVDVKRSYRYEQGFTYELNLAGAGDRATAGVRGRAAVMGQRQSMGPRGTWPRGRGKGAVDRGGAGERPGADAGRGGRRAARRDDDRDRRLGIAPQADGAGARDPAVAAAGPHGGVLRGPGRGAAHRVRARRGGSSPGSRRSTRSRSSRISGTGGSAARSS